ncbi:MAG: hypothetical protein DLM69_02320 [Candidatus Chloroheliales bacterium]|nr:MAG: hypothetical protein DLM69_02320 [Chloroflexota bacterium]
MSQDNVKIIKDAHDAFNRGDIPAVLATLDPAIVWEVPKELPYGGIFHGVSEVGGFFQSLRPYFQEFRVESEHQYTVGDQVVDLGHFRGKGKHGQKLEAANAFIWAVRNGKVVSFHEVSDTAALLEAIK